MNNRDLQRIIDALQDGVYITDAKGITLTVNKAYERITGIQRHKVVGLHMSEVVKAGYISRSVSLEVLRELQPVTLVQTIHDSRKIVVSGTPMFDSTGDLEYIVTTVRDVTELLRAKHAQEQLQELLTVRDTYGLTPSTNVPAQDLIVSKATRASYELARRVASTSAKVLIEGETGTGKTMLARFIHQHSATPEGPFLELNCAAMPEALLEAELFGYAPGAFTGASSKGKPGLLEVASGGTLLLDEIGDLPLSLQAKLLKVLSENRLLPVGGTEFKPTNFRLVCATHRQLRQQVEQGKFREDLFYRISVVPVTLPSLRERREEITPLLQHYLNVFNQQHEHDCSWSNECLTVLKRYDWPGNIRELMNLTERMVVTAESAVIQLQHLPSEVFPDWQPREVADDESLKARVDNFEQHIIEMALAEHGTTRAAAAVLGIDQSTLVKKLKRWRNQVPKSDTSELTPVKN
ncbi:hypothetical protein CWE13_06595 [Aliidiomarina shirensis]|uniref:Uncharacterized protein n=1 Tax=Aliidiomarina shirensis TaxID=1048642 RepID=A0A432WV40_9GAMM|nr:sigma 54-interacting transcriptional regulator [Aliidiomarina shirensis]RUO37617.1 hypothetical protein CWE13_06595 [Aliidiomarina shirensis]